MNGNSSTATAEPSPAAALLEKHLQPSAEEVPDEEDIIHPPPSLLAAKQNGTLDDGSSAGLSARAAGKQKMKEESRPFDTQSNEMFPELGSGPKPKNTMPTAWSATKGQTEQSSKLNGTHSINGSPSIGIGSLASSGTSTPRSGMNTPNSSAPSGWSSQGFDARGPALVSLPGRYTDRITMRPGQMKNKSQLKKPIQEILRNLNRRSKATIEMRPSPDGGYVFEGRGPENAVREALRDIAREIGVKQTIPMRVPASVRSHIIGRQGSTIQSISQESGAKIQLPKFDSTTRIEDDDDEDIEILIEGDSVGVSLAKARIQNIVNERTANATQRLKNIPVEFFPFIAGLQNNRSAEEQDGDLRVQVPSYHTWSTQPPPQPLSGSDRPTFRPSNGPSIQISGERLAVQQARAEIERQVQELHERLTTSQLEINQGQHQFVMGERGMSATDFLEATGCAVVLPPPHANTEILTIIGPDESIEDGINKVMELASSMQLTNVDVARQHPRAPKGAANHARYVTRYLQQRREIERLERLYDAHIALPSFQDGSSAWEVYSRGGPNGLRAKQEITNIINGHPPSRLAHVEVEPFYHQHLNQLIGASLREQYGVHAVFPEEIEETPEIILVYEGVPVDGVPYEVPKKQPSASEVAEFERSLVAAQQFLMSLVAEHEPITTETLEMPKKFHEKTKRFVKKQQEELPTDRVPVRIHSLKGQDPNSANEIVTLRGPTSDVATLCEAIKKFIAQEEIDEKERGHIISFPYPQKYANFLIGKRGETINKYREEFDVDIQINDGKVEIKGPKAKGEAAKAKIIALAKRLEDEATHVLKIEPRFHRDLIGVKGSQVNRLQERYKVKVSFPRNQSAVTGEDDQSIADTSSEVGGGRRNGRPNQAPDEVIIRGPKKGADEARDEILSLLQYTKDNSFTSTVSVARGQLPMLIGQGGREMENLRLATGATIDVPDAKRDGDSSSERVELKLKGTKKQVEDAKKLLEQRASVFDDTITRSIEVDKQYLKALIGTGGANIRDLVQAAGGSTDRRDLARIVRFPSPDSPDKTVRIEGPSAVVNALVKSITAFVSEREGHVSVSLPVPVSQHRQLIGRGGDVKRSIENRFQVAIEVPRQGADPETPVKITGQQAAVNEAKAHIVSLLKESAGETIQIPLALHHKIADNGSFFRRLRSDFRVTVDHAGVSIPPKNSPTVDTGSSEPLPLITDTDPALPYTWTMLTTAPTDNNNGEASSSTIPWTLRGPSDTLPLAVKRLQQALAQANAHNTTGYLGLPDPRAYRLVIGPQGSQINAIRKETGTSITVPRSGGAGGAGSATTQASAGAAGRIEIVGDREGVERAKDIIVELVMEKGGRA